MTNRTVYEDVDGFYMDSETMESFWIDTIDGLNGEDSYHELNNVFTRATKDSKNGWYKVAPDTGITVAQVKEAIQKTLGEMRGSDTVTFTSAEGENFA